MENYKLYRGLNTRIIWILHISRPCDGEFDSQFHFFSNWTFIDVQRICFHIVLTININTHFSKKRKKPYDLAFKYNKYN